MFTSTCYSVCGCCHGVISIGQFISWCLQWWKAFSLWLEDIIAYTQSLRPNTMCDNGGRVKMTQPPGVTMGTFQMHVRPKAIGEILFEILCLQGQFVYITTPCETGYIQLSFPTSSYYLKLLRSFRKYNRTEVIFYTFWPPFTLLFRSQSSVLDTYDIFVRVNAYPHLKSIGEIHHQISRKQG